MALYAATLPATHRTIRLPDSPVPRDPTMSREGCPLWPVAAAVEAAAVLPPRAAVEAAAAAAAAVLPPLPCRPRAAASVPLPPPSYPPGPDAAGPASSPSPPSMSNECSAAGNAPPLTSAAYEATAPDTAGDRSAYLLANLGLTLS